MPPMLKRLPVTFLGLTDELLHPSAFTQHHFTHVEITVRIHPETVRTTEKLTRYFTRFCTAPPRNQIAI